MTPLRRLASLWSRKRLPDHRALEARASQPLRDLEDLNASPKLKGPSLMAQAEAIAQDGWTRWGHTVPSLRPPVAWHGPRGSFDYSLHGFEPLTILVPAYEFSGDAALYHLITNFVADWLEVVQAPELCDPKAAIRRILKEPPTPEWYDMAVGLRIYRLAFVLDAVVHKEPERHVLIDQLIAALEFHHALLAEERFFTPGSNHGLYQALGQLAAARRFEHDLGHARYAELAEARLERLLAAHFFPSGVHKEHSPGYHYMVMGSLMGALADDVVRLPHLRAMIGRMEQVLAAMIQPDGMLTTFGDSDPRPMRWDPRIAVRIGDPALRFILTQGVEGTPPREGVSAYLDAGYAFARMTPPGVQPSAQTTAYLAQISAYHSNVHKHADHLGFSWFDHGRDVLIDPGRFAYAGQTDRKSALRAEGFRYADPRRIYVESTHAHNCVEIDGKSDPRVKVPLFGSALVGAREQDGLAIFESRVARAQGLDHRRVLVMVPGRALLVLDHLEGEKDFAAAQWFKFAPEWHLEMGEGRLLAQASARDDLPAATLSVFDLAAASHLKPEAYRGQEVPDLRGWTSDKADSLIPATSLSLSAHPGKTALFATFFVWGEAARVPESTLADGLSSGRVAWHDAQGPMALSFTINALGAAEVQVWS